MVKYEAVRTNPLSPEQIINYKLRIRTTSGGSVVRRNGQVANIPMIRFSLLAFRVVVPVDANDNDDGNGWEGMDEIGIGTIAL